MFYARSGIRILPNRRTAGDDLYGEEVSRDLIREDSVTSQDKRGRFILPSEKGTDFLTTLWASMPLNTTSAVVD